MTYYCGVDIGGTFTDCVVLDDAGNVLNAKTSSTPPDFHDGFLNVLQVAATKLDVSLEDFLAQTDLLLHGTTVGTNVLVQMRGAKTGLLATAGHGDALITMRSYGRSAGLPIDRLLHVSRHRKPDPLIPPWRIKEVPERIDWSGAVFLELNEDDARRAIQELVAEGVEAIAIALLWGFVNPVHELRVKELVREIAPDIFVCCAHELIAKPGEYERTAATAINAFIGPSTSSYVEQVDRATTERGYRHPLLIMQAAGGVVPADEAAAKPLFTIGSGPVGGVTGAAYLARQMGHQNVIAADMGGTSFDVGIIADGEPLTASETIINQYTFFMPRLDIESIGAGGGSIVWLDEESRTLRVGPESAGARPGPACYDAGGTQPTVTDCDLILGRYNPGSFLGGNLELDPRRAESALEPIASELGMELVEAADGALRIVESQMADLMRQMTVERGRDPRDFVVYAFGGAGGAHAVEFARELGCRQVVIPLGDFASTWSALGVMSSDVLHVHEHSELVRSPFPADQLNAIFNALEEKAREQLEREGFTGDQIDMSRFADMKFSMQIHQVEVPVPGGTLTDLDAEEQVPRFIERYEQTYGEGSAFVDAGSQIGVFRVLARGRLRTPALPNLEERPAPEVRAREVYWRDLGGFHTTDVVTGHALGAGFEFEGPTILDLPDTTVVVPPGARGHIDPLGSIVIDVNVPAGVAEQGTAATDAP